WDKHSPQDPQDRKFHQVPTQARVGQLRLRREGSTLRYLVAEGLGEDFHEIFQQDFGKEDVEIVRFIVNNHNCPVGVDARLVDLKARPSGRPRALASAGGEGPVGRANALAAARLAGLVLLAAAVAWGASLHVRSRRTAQGAARAPVPTEQTEPQAGGPAVLV